jgi:hypothetical protein
VFEWVLEDCLFNEVIWGCFAFPVGGLAAWSIAVDSVVLVQIAKWLVPKSVLTGRLPKEAINSEETDTCHFFAQALSYLSFNANNF